MKKPKPNVRRRLALTMRMFLAEGGRLYVTLEDALEVALSTELAAVLYWLARSDAPRPRVLGTPHVVGVRRDMCTSCGALMGGVVPRAYGVPRFVAGDLVGRDCTPPKRRARR